jgi:hypothetical protein
MKVIKGLILACFLGTVVSGCFEAPVFNNTPSISFQKILFKETPSAGDYDTLVLYLNFKDGDGDLGLSDDYTDDPYHASYYYLAAGPERKDTVRVTTTVVYQSVAPFNSYIMLESDQDVEGPLVTDRTRSVPGFGDLPAYDPNSCLNYSYSEVLVPEAMQAVDATYNIKDTLRDQSNRNYFLVEEALLYKRNPYHNNIEIEFWVLQNNGYQYFDWYKEFCIDFNGRFPVLGDEERPLEGTIRYAMANPGFLALFGTKTLKLRVRIRDRALNTSTQIETPAFTLSGI